MRNELSAKGHILKPKQGLTIADRMNLLNKLKCSPCISDLISYSPIIKKGDLEQATILFSDAAF